MRGWTLKSVTYDGRDVTDRPIEIRSGQKLTNVLLTFTDKVTEINGTITTDRGDPSPDYTVLAFSTDNSFWRPQSRHIPTARPDQTGKFRIRGLPAGELLPRRRSIPPSRASGSSRRISTSTASAPRASR